jgi:hypothetical protein
MGFALISHTGKLVCPTQVGTHVVGFLRAFFKNMPTKLFKKPNKPSVEEVERYIQLWRKNESLSLPAKSLENLFKKFPKNKNIEEIIVKVCTLDVIFSVNVGRWFLQVSKHISEYNFDTKFEKDSFNLNEFALVDIGKSKKRDFYSFTTKYCSHYKPSDYPIYDSYIEKILWYFKTTEEYSSFSQFSRKELKDYATFKRVLEDFRKFFGLEKFNPREIDKYLWQLGKEVFSEQNKLLTTNSG